MSNPSFVAKRLPMLLAARRLMTVCPNNAELSIRSLNGRLSFSTYSDGIAAIEMLSEQIDFPDVAVDLDKFFTFLQARHEDDIKVTLAPGGLKLAAGRSSALVHKKELRFVFGLPTSSELIGEISSNAFDDLARVANISEDKDLARPLLQGVFLMIANGDIRTLSANGIAFGYAWEQNETVKATGKENFLLKATALSLAQRYDWQNEPKIKVYRPTDKLRMLCFSTRESFVFLSEMAEKDKFPHDMIIEAAKDSVSPKSFVVSAESFKTYINAAVKLSGYDDRSVTVALTNGKVMISSGKQLKSEVEERGLDFVGFFEIMECANHGDDFIFCLDAKMAKQAMALLGQVDKGGSLRVAFGSKTGLIFFSTPLANALYGIAQITR